MRLILPIMAALAATTAMPAIAQAPGEINAVRDPDCDRQCLLDVLSQHMEALRAGDATAAGFASDAVFTENNVVIEPGEGLWKTVTAVDEAGLEAADPSTGNAAWFGSVREHGEPVVYALRIHVKDGKIDEAETVVHRKTALPAPFGDVENMVHDPEFNEILPPEQRRTRERMLAIADSYFDTVEVNDGQVFAPFSEDCGRLENGISTTAPTPGGPGGNAAMIASGCLEQFKLGIYRINKRIRRDFFIVDEERGVAVGRGFFDHANEFDRYLLTNGHEMKTALKWPNTITLLEAFRIKNAEIQRIEAVFTYVPYFMHNPFWGPKSDSPYYAPEPDVCDDACLSANAKLVMNSYVGNQWQAVPWAHTVGYAENSVGIRIGESVWRTATAVDSKPLVVADDQTGKAVWIGRIEEHGQPAWAAMTMMGAGDKVGGIDLLVRRKEYAPPYSEPTAAPTFSALPAGQRSSRKDMIATTEAFYAAMNTNESAPEGLADNCRWLVNGADIAPCGPTFGTPVLDAIEQVRDRDVLAVDEERGLVVYRTFEDRPGDSGTAGDYPLTYQVVELFRIVGGKVEQVHAYTSELPYGMKPH